MWSTNLEGQAELARERFEALRHNAQRRAQQRRRRASALAAGSGRLLAHTGAWLLTLGHRLQQDDADCAPVAGLS